MEDGEVLRLAAHRMSLEAQPCSQPRSQPRSQPPSEQKEANYKELGAETS
jgi:hypothetical protein